MGRGTRRVELGFFKQAKRWLLSFDRAGSTHGLDLGVVDDLLAIFVGVAVYLTTIPWVTQVRGLIGAIVASVSLTVLALVFAANQRFPHSRYPAYAASLLMARIAVPWMMRASADDLAPQMSLLKALPLGVAVWMGVREVAIYSLNLSRTLSRLESAPSEDASTAVSASDA